MARCRRPDDAPSPRRGVALATCLSFLLALPTLASAQEGALPLTLENINRRSAGASAVSVSPNGEWIAITGQGPSGSGVYLLNGRDGSAEPELWIEAGSLHWTSDSRSVVFARGGEVWTARVPSGAPRQMTSGVGDAREPVFSPEGTAIAFYSGTSGAQDIWIVPADGSGSPRRLTTDAAADDDPRFTPSWSPDGTTIAYVSNRADYWADDVWLVEVVTGTARQLSHSLMASSTPVWSPDGSRINYRGGSGFGRAFQDLAVEDWLNAQALDAGAAGDFLRNLPFTTDKVGIYGGSYGGSMSMAAITRTPDKFDAAVAMRGAYSKTETFEQTDRLGKIFSITGHGGLPEDRPEIYSKSNTIERIADITAPVLLMHGEEDRRVPFQHFELAVEALKRYDKEFETKNYPGEGHGFSNPGNRIDMYRRLEDFFTRHLGACEPR